MGLLAQIQSEAMSDVISVTTLLRKVMVLASNLDSNLLEDWVRHELNGYPSDVDVPKYRTMAINFKANGASIAYQYNNFPIAQLIVEKAAGRKDISLFKCRQAIGTINPSDISTGNGTLQLNFDNYAPLIEKHLTEGISVFSFWGEIPSSQVLGILEAVRNRVLDFVLALKKSYPDAGEMNGLTTKNAEVEKFVTNNYYNTIHGNVGVAGAANNSTINITVKHGNLQDLRRQLTHYGVDAKDIDELENAVLAEPATGADHKFGPIVAGWMGTMASKAASGAWNIGLEVAGSVMKKALLGYYGLDA